ncbi:MAG TPA: calcium-binding EGF-like domain-containing protein [Myxococcales bacterium]
MKTWISRLVVVGLAAVLAPWGCLQPSPAAKCKADSECSTGQICESAACVEAQCEATCAGSERCLKGRCYPAECPSAQCAKGEVCAGGACLDEDCVGMSCPTGKECAAGRCYFPDCSVGAPCEAGEVCVSGVCTATRCVGVSCPEGEACAAAQCFPKDCSGATCEAKSVCAQGACVDARCVGISCAEGTACVAGTCQGPSCFDGLWNSDETGKDCGGSCPGCSEGLGCRGDGDCAAKICRSGICASRLCTASSECGADADCLDRSGLRICVCRDGYQRASGACIDVDECADSNGGCSPLATCTNVPGSRSCTCQPHYLGDGLHCVAEERTATCTGLPANAVWNTATSINQTWDGAAWSPSEVGSYDPAPSATECRFGCVEGYGWADGACRPRWITVDLVFQAVDTTETFQVGTYHRCVLIGKVYDGSGAASCRLAGTEAGPWSITVVDSGTTFPQKCTVRCAQQDPSGDVSNGSPCTASGLDGIVDAAGQCCVGTLWDAEGIPDVACY